MRRALLVLVLAVALARGAAAEDIAFDFKIAAGHLTSGPQNILVHQGDHVTLRWNTDRRITLHLHGYDIEIVVEPGTAKVMSFNAYATGRFPIHIHARGAGAEDTLGYLEVYPR
jgi:hypothetical protein